MGIASATWQREGNHGMLGGLSLLSDDHSHTSILSLGERHTDPVWLELHSCNGPC